jgi:hypothetical protein
MGLKSAIAIFGTIALVWYWVSDWEYPPEPPPPKSEAEMWHRECVKEDIRDINGCVVRKARKKHNDDAFERVQRELKSLR